MKQKINKKEILKTLRAYSMVIVLVAIAVLFHFLTDGLIFTSMNLTNLIPAEAPAQGWAQSFGVWAAGVVFVVLTLAATLGAVAVQVFWLQGVKAL